jgi:outer membrane protein assembly factor BamB
VYAAPTVVGDLVFIGSCVGTFFALDRVTGQVRWSYDIVRDGDQSGFHGNPLVVNDEIITGTDGAGIGHVYAFEMSTGKVRWKHPMTKGAPSSYGLNGNVVRLGHAVFGATIGDELISLNAETGKLNWSFASGYTGTAFRNPQSPATGNGRVFFGGINGMVYALSAESGQVIWKRNLGERVSTDLVVAGDGLYAGTAGGEFFRLNTDTGEITAEIKLGTIPVGLPAMLADSVLIYLNRGAGAGGQTLVSLDPGLKQIRWQQRAATNWSVAARPFVWRSTVLAGNGQGEVRAFRISDGKEVWWDTLKGTIRSFGSGARDSMIVIGTLEGMVYAYQPALGG